MWCYITIDFAQVFDKASHILEHKLSKLGIINQPLMWIKDFLCNRYQRVLYKCSVSTLAKVVSGFIQGSAIINLLFTVYISDLAEVVDLSDLIFLSDDSKTVDPVRKHDRIQMDLNNIGAWSKRNHSRFVLTNVLHFIMVCIIQ